MIAFLRGMERAIRDMATLAHSSFPQNERLPRLLLALILSLATGFEIVLCRAVEAQTVDIVFEQKFCSRQSAARVRSPRGRSSSLRRLQTRR
jgi:hypothetical protein